MAISEFQLALTGAGATAVVGVWAYNIWQEYRQRKVADRIFRGTQDDVLIDEQEPVDDIDAPAFVRAAAPRQESRIQPGTESRIEPVITMPRDEIGDDDTSPISTEVTDQPAPAPANVVEEPGEEQVDPMIEIGIALPPALKFAVLQAAWQGMNTDFRKRVRWVARDSGSDVWCEVDGLANQEANHVYVTIQLADRQGPIDRNELETFCHQAESVVIASGEKNIGFPVLDEIIAHARAIDDFCASVDIQIAIHIVGSPGQTFAGTKLRGMLEASGLQLAADGLFYLYGPDGKRQLSVCNSGAVPFDIEQMRTGNIADITFWLDVPRVGNGGAVFDIMLATARQLAEALEGVLVDDQRNPLSGSALAVIRAKVAELQTQMAAHGIPAGGRRALRLFS